MKMSAECLAQAPLSAEAAHFPRLAATTSWHSTIACCTHRTNVSRELSPAAREPELSDKCHLPPSNLLTSKIFSHERGVTIAAHSRVRLLTPPGARRRLRTGHRFAVIRKRLPP